MLCRAGMLLALALFIPSCTEEDAGDRELIVVNNTASALIIEVDADVENSNWGEDVDDDIAILQPGQIYSEKFKGADEVDVRITRQSDGVILFAASYDVDDFADEDGEIRIIINP